VLITNCSNNYGPYHFPEKLIPLTIINGLEGVELPVYGNGRGNVRRTGFTSRNPGPSVGDGSAMAWQGGLR